MGQPGLDATARSQQERARRAAIRERFRGGPATLEEIRGSADFGDATTLGGYSDLARTLDALKAAREAAGLTLAEVSRKSGIDPAALSRLENGKAPNPTVGTLHRYAAAVGKRLAWTISDSSAD